MTEYLEFADVLHLIDRLNVNPIRDQGLLDSALHRPRSSAFGQDAYPTLAEKAAALMHSLARNHPLVDGNKRLAWAACRVFLEINGWRPGLTEDEAFDLVMAVARGDADVPEIAKRFALHPVDDQRD
ncbi:MAG: type II toxin-antitoxin system death-on-curing family toxin [Kineosporiaceae bacterium]